ncbi:APA family basic amino acid/polyamine antiporter [Arthrobacter stackebrandtii]|uniref:APA family basic amino acid/polyamine antiporter n=1 Tax=Arthrobacter stackebrandtii TaxID=272161 RepID=A0ABS4YSB1_9MICC|nr:amino acid permease [Arthrobacter stackebrandtii]MBP2411693.1 APA family basic amino acid/polyamine antiporter [Arthrobacter stackebrandtii]PYG99665.1 amino acid permease [Arthrobacter stackebrandtii]
MSALDEPRAAKSAGRSGPSLGLGRQLLRRKPIAQMVQEAGSGTEGRKLVRSFGVLQLTMISVGATLGTGIFVILGDSVPMAGPAIFISFLIAGVAALLSAISYAEMAGMVPVSGSSYSYTYATLGEGMAWICGWCLVLEYAVSVAAVAVGAGQYINESVAGLGWVLPDFVSQPPGSGGVMNLPAMVIVLLCMVLLMRGARESAWVNTAIVLIKIVILLFFCAVAFTAFNAGNFDPLLPMGTAGVSAAASRVFFSYIGFDAASTAGEEARNPQRDLPRAIMLSMVIVTSVYVLVAVAAIGARDWTWFDGTEAALVQILLEITGKPWIGAVFAIGAVLAITSVVLAVLYGQTRILVSMSRDGLVPKVFGRISAKRGTPVAGTLIVGIAVALTAGLVPLGALADATSIGTLFAFALVNVSVVYLRRNRPELKRSYRVAFYPVTPILGALMCVYLMINLGGLTWLVFLLWMVVGQVAYFAYGRRHSKVAALSQPDYEVLSAAPIDPH